jgi:hypothetical protein
LTYFHGHRGQTSKQITKLACFVATVNREIFTALVKVGEFAFFQLAVDKIPRLLQKFNG